MLAFARNAFGQNAQSYMRNDVWSRKVCATSATRSLHKPRSPFRDVARHVIRSVSAASASECTWTWPLLHALDARPAWRHGVRVALRRHSEPAEFAAHVRSECAGSAARRLHNTTSPFKGVAESAMRSVSAATAMEQTWTWPLQCACNAMTAWLHGVRPVLPRQSGPAGSAGHALRPRRLVRTATCTTRRTCLVSRGARKQTAPA